ncbi:MAG: threonine/serine exporter family protein [Nocardioidaceae bacterium]
MADSSGGGSRDSRDVYRTLDLALRVGEVLLSSGAGAADVGATMLNVARACGLRTVTADVTFTELAMSHQTSFDEPALIQLRQVRHREIDYGDLTHVDHLVRDLLAGRIDRAEARARLARVVSSGHRLPRWAATLGYGAMGGGVGLLVGGSWRVALLAAGASMGVDLIQREMSTRRWPSFYQQVAGGLFATLIAVLAAASGTDLSPSLVITAGIIMMLAGVSFMGAIQDALTGYPLTAGARILEAMLATAGLIAGVSGGLAVSRMLDVDLGRLDPGATLLGDIPLMSLGSALAAAAFAFASYAPLRSLLPIATIAGVAQLVNLVVQDAGLGIAWGAAVAAVLIGVVSFSVAGRVRVPPLVVVVPAVVPMLPGLSIYRGLSLMAEGEDGILPIAKAAAIAIALAAGVIFGEYLAQPLKREARRLETRLAGPRLVGPLRMHTHRPRRHRSRGAKDSPAGQDVPG